MARANLKISDELGAAMVAANQQAGANVRAVLAKIQDETIVLASQIDKKGDEKADFNALATVMTENDPAFIIFRGAERWTMVSYIPETAQVRDKMMFASSLDDLKEQLGKGYFVSDYHCTTPVELSWEAFQASLAPARSTNMDDAPLTVAERAKLEESRMAMDRETKSSGMATVAFTMKDEIKSALTELVAGKRLAVEIRIDMKDEHCELGSCAAAASAADLAGSAPAQPRIYVLRQSADDAAEVAMVFYCPDGSSVKARMVYSTAKSSIIENCEAVGVKFSRKREYRSAEELLSVWDVVVVPAPMATKSFKKPTRKTGGKRRARGRVKKKFDAGAAHDDGF